MAKKATEDKSSATAKGNKADKKKVEKPKKQKKEKTITEMLSRVEMVKIKNNSRISKEHQQAVFDLHEQLNKGKTWNDKNVQALFKILPDAFPFCGVFIHTDALIKIGKVKQAEVVLGSGTHSKLKWVPVDEAKEQGISTQHVMRGYKIRCGTCQKVFVGREPFHQNHCHPCSAPPPKPAKPKKDKE